MAEWINDPQGREEIEKVTKELKLPVWKANHKGKFRDFWNELWDKIEDYILKLKRDTEKNSKGLNDRLVSAVGKHDGDFPIANAVVGNVYYSELTKKYYKCKVEGPAPMPNGNFIDMSILENLNRLENLYKIKTYGYNNSADVRLDMYIHYTVLKIMNICILEVKYSRVAAPNVLYQAADLPIEFRPLHDVFISGTSKHSESMDYHWIRLTTQGKFYTHNTANSTVRNLQAVVAYECASYS